MSREVKTLRRYLFMLVLACLFLGVSNILNSFSIMDIKKEIKKYKIKLAKQ